MEPTSWWRHSPIAACASSSRSPATRSCPCTTPPSAATCASSIRATKRRPCTWLMGGAGYARSPASPLVLLSGHAPAAQAGRGAFQEIDQAGAAAPVTKASWVAKDAARLGEDMALALELARSGRPGPVHMSLPGDLLDAKVSNGGAVVMDAARHSMTVADADLRRLRELLEASRRPLVLLGPAMSRAARRAAVEQLTGPTDIPALPMESPRGVNDPWLHMASNCLGQADLVRS